MTAIIKLDANEHPIKSVTVFKSKKAEVVRIFKVSLEEGQNKVQIRNLSGSIDTESVRVTGLGDAQLFDVVCSFGTDSEEIDTSSNAEAVRKLNARRDLLEENIERYYDVSGMMMTYARSLTGSSLGPQQAETFFESLLSRSCAMASARAELDEEITQLERQSDAISSTKTKKQGRTDREVSVVIMAKKATDIELSLTYLVRNATWSAAYELHATTEAGIPARSVSLHYRARITQSTGEDWTGVELTLSTADMDLPNKTIPVLSPTKIRPPVPGPLFDFKAGGYAKPQRPPQPIAVGQTSVPPALPTQLNQSSNTGLGVGGNAPTQKPFQPIAVGQTSIPPAQLTKVPNTGIGASSTPAGITSAKKAQPTPPPPQSGLMRDLYRAITQSSTIPTDEWQEIKLDAPVSAQVITTANGKPMSVVHESPLASTYRVEGASGVPSDGVSHQVCIAVLPFEAKIQHVTVPKERQEAYLEATVRNTSDYRLLPGTVHAFLDDSFVSKISIDGDVAPGGEFSCTLGADPATHIRYVRMAKRADDTGPAGERRAFTEQWAATTYRSRMTVTNQHPFALGELVVRDGLPVSENEKCVSVVLRRPAGLADLEQGEECEVGAKDGGREGEGKQHSVRWSKAVDGKGGKKEGLFEWVVEVGAGEELTIDTEWDVKAPTSLRWVEST